MSQKISFGSLLLIALFCAPVFVHADATTTPDTTAPVITPPADQTFATSTFPASPALVWASATDDTDPDPVITYAPQTFPLGTTTVTWTATDASGNSSNAASQVIVIEEATTSPYIPLIIEDGVEVPASCTVTDTDGVTHSYETASTTAYLGICALQAALDSSLINTAGLSNQFPSFGLFVASINDVAADPSSQYWALYQNGSLASLGITALPVVAGDTIMLQLHDFSDNPTGDQLTLHINSLISTSTATTTQPEPPQNNNVGGGSVDGHYKLNIAAAINFLSGKQSADGSFGDANFTDWTAIALAAVDPSEAASKIKTFLLTATPPMNSITDYERHAMALEALGIDPYSGAATDYITPIVNAFDGTQIGDAHLDNDDIFAVFPLLKAGYAPNDQMMQKIGAFIVGAQNSDGSWDESVDMTAAAVQAEAGLLGSPLDQDLSASMTKALAYLASVENSNASWGSPSSIDSTSWVQTMINTGKTPDFRSSAGFLPNDSIYYAQQADGSVQSSIPLWSTSYAITAASGKYWMSILHSFPKPSATTISTGGGLVLGASTSTAATSTSDVIVATSTPAEIAATSTPLIASSTPQAATSSVQVPQKKFAKAKPKVKTPAPSETRSSAPVEAAAAAIPSSGGFVHFVIQLFSKIFSFF